MKKITNEELASMMSLQATPTQVSEIPEYVRANLHKVLDHFLDSFTKAVEMTTVQQISANLEGAVKGYAARTGVKSADLAAIAGAYYTGAGRKNGKDGKDGKDAIVSPKKEAKAKTGDGWKISMTAIPPQQKREVSKGRRLHGIYIGHLHGLTEAQRKQGKAIRAKDGVEKAIAFLKKLKK